jgi:hypothetical protein
MCVCTCVFVRLYVFIYARAQVSVDVDAALNTVHDFLARLAKDLHKKSARGYVCGVCSRGAGWCVGIPIDETHYSIKTLVCTVHTCKRP